MVGLEQVVAQTVDMIALREGSSGVHHCQGESEQAEGGAGVQDRVLQEVHLVGRTAADGDHDQPVPVASGKAA